MAKIDITALTNNNYQWLRDAYKKHWKDKVVSALKEQWLYDEVLKSLKDEKIKNIDLGQKEESTNSWSSNSADIDLTNPNNLVGLKNAVKLKGQDWVNSQIAEKGYKYDETAGWLVKLTNASENSASNTQNLVDKNGPESTIFPQYEQKNISDEERKNIEEVQKSYYEPYFNRQRERTTSDYNVDKNILNRLIDYSRTDTAIDLAKINTTFAKSMSKAQNAYWKRNIIWSWIQTQEAWETVDQLGKDEYNREEYWRRKREWLEDRKDNIKTTFNRWLTDINENQDAQTYFDTLKEIENRQSEYTRQFQQGQENTDFSLTTPTESKNKTYSNQDLKNKQNLLF